MIFDYAINVINFGSWHITYFIKDLDTNTYRNKLIMIIDGLIIIGISNSGGQKNAKNKMIWNQFRIFSVSKYILYHCVFMQ